MCYLDRVDTQSSDPDNENSVANVDTGKRFDGMITCVDSIGNHSHFRKWDITLRGTKIVSWSFHIFSKTSWKFKTEPFHVGTYILLTTQTDLAVSACLIEINNSLIPR